MKLTIMNLGNLSTGKELEKVIKDNFSFLDPFTTDRNVFKELFELRNGNLFMNSIENTMLEQIKYHGRKGLYLVVTDKKVNEYYPIPYSGGKFKERTEPGFTVFNGTLNVAVVSNKGLRIKRELIGRAIHEIGHWYGLDHHSVNEEFITQCPMAGPEIDAGKYEFKHLDKLTGTRLCGGCKDSVNPEYKK